MQSKFFQNNTLLPTADLHNHMEAIPVKLVKQLAKKNNVILPADIFTEDGQSYNWTDFLEFLKRYDDGASVIKDLDDITVIAYEFLQRGYTKSNCIYTELTVSTIHLCKATNKSYSEVIEAVVAGIKKAENDFKIHARINIVLVRHEGGFTEDGINTSIPVEICNMVVSDVINNRHDYVKGIVLAGAEAQFPPALFREACDKARAAGLKISVHAGEVTDAQDVINAIDFLSPDRIGHGIRATENPLAVALLKKKEITLEICPSSNIMLGNTAEDLPHLQRLHAEGVKIVIGTDDASHFGSTTISHEYQKVSHVLNLSQKQQLAITRHAISVSFAEDALKKKLNLKLDAFEKMLGLEEVNLFEPQL